VLQRYCHKGYIIPIKKGLYTVLNVLENEPIVNKFEIATALTESSYVSYRSAFEYFGVANQVSYEISVISEQKFNGFEFNGYEYVRFAPTINSGVIEQSDGIRVSCLERTVIDCISNFENRMGLEELLNCLSSIALLSEDKLLNYLEEYNIKFLYQKTGFLLEHFKENLYLSDYFFDTLKKKSGTSSKYLIKNISKDNMGYDSKWHLMYPKNGGNEYADV
jgi:predicted transcriptional regulator of viral defense system